MIALTLQTIFYVHSVRNKIVSLFLYEQSNTTCTYYLYVSRLKMYIKGHTISKGPPNTKGFKAAFISPTNSSISFGLSLNCRLLNIHI